MIVSAGPTLPIVPSLLKPVVAKATEDKPWQKMGITEKGARTYITALKGMVDRLTPRQEMAIEQLSRRYQSDFASPSRWESGLTPEEADAEIDKLVQAQEPVVKAALGFFEHDDASEGSISTEAHETLNFGINCIAKSLRGVKTMEELGKIKDGKHPRGGSGEGGEGKYRDNTSFQSASRQIGTANFGAEDRFLRYAHEIKFKISQGAKPIKGGQVQLQKLTPRMRETRGFAVADSDPLKAFYEMNPNKLPEDMYVYSPNALYHSIEELTRQIEDVLSVNPGVDIAVKFTSNENAGAQAVAVAKTLTRTSGMKKICIAGPGGTGAATINALKEYTRPWVEGLTEAHKFLTENGLRDIVTLATSGGFKDGHEAFKACLMGADKVQLTSAGFLALDCIMARVCHDNTCPKGIATTDPDLVAKFTGDPVKVARFYIEALAKPFAENLKAHGFSSPEEARGRTDLLKIDDDAIYSDALKEKLVKPENPFAHLPIVMPSSVEGSSEVERRVIEQIYEENPMDGSPIKIMIEEADFPSFGGRIAKEALDSPEFKAKIETVGVEVKVDTPGQSFGYCLPKGITLVANLAKDQVGQSSKGNIYAHSIGINGGKAKLGGDLMSVTAAGRWAYLARGGTLASEVVGNNASNKSTGGLHMVLGTGKCYPDTSLEHSYEDVVVGRNAYGIGHNYGADTTGNAVIVMPTVMVKEGEERFFATDFKESFRALPPTSAEFPYIQNAVSTMARKLPESQTARWLNRQLTNGKPIEFAQFALRVLRYTPK